jgi:hypothetical protein
VTCESTSYSISRLIIITSAGIFSLIEGITTHQAPASKLLAFGLGTVDPRVFIPSWEDNVPISGSGALLSNVLLSNMLQPILSLLYFAFNDIFTCIMLALEWSGYMDERKGLRVSTNPAGSQRASYFLQIPFKFAIPLMSLSSFLHWLGSQSIFLVSIHIDHSILDGTDYAAGYNGTSYDDNNGILNYITCGYSPTAIFCTSVISMSMIVGLVSIRWRKFGNAMPLAGSCSAAISAACHLNEDEDGEETSLAPVQWGVAEEEQVVEGLRSRVGHCSFSGRDVEPPKSNCLYAGIGKET